MEENTLYQITGYQIIYTTSRDNVKLQQPVIVEDLEAYRREVVRKHNAVGVNLSYVEIKMD